MGVPGFPSRRLNGLRQALTCSRHQTSVVADAIFEHPGLADIYDAVDANRSHLDLYVA